MGGKVMSDELEVLLKELDEIRSAKESARSAILSMYGIVFPGLISVFVFVADRGTGPTFSPEILTTICVILGSLGTIWTQFLWIEYLGFVRYYYLELLPRVYETSGQTHRLSFLEWSSPRTARQWLPLLLFNVGCLAAFLIAICWIWGHDWRLLFMSLGFLIAACVCVVTTLFDFHKLQVAIGDRVKAKRPASNSNAAADSAQKEIRD
jgi:hypothetical protein